MLKLKIENFDRLPDGGPLEYSVDRRGFDFGRDGHLDWTLPDKSRIVSGKHCEVRYYDDAYWLVDVSTNGTFVNGANKRVASPYQLNEGDQLQVGEYVISVTLDLPPFARDAPHAPAQLAAAPSNPGGKVPSFGGNIWETGEASPPPLDVRELMPKPAPAEVAPDYLNQALFVPEPIIEQVAARPQPRPSSKWSTEPNDIAPQPPALFSAAPASASAQTPDIPTAGAFTRHFARGAGLAEETLSKIDDAELAELAGQLLRVTTSQLMALLQARADAKSISRSGKRTMVKAVENNPLKFMPTPEEALQVMLLPRGKSYLNARETLESTFADLKLHHFALLAAMQASANEMFKELSPEAVEQASSAKKSILGGSKGKLWDDISARWAAKSGKRENGMLDAFLDVFAEHYDAYSKRKTEN